MRRATSRPPLPRALRVQHRTDAKYLFHRWLDEDTGTSHDRGHRRQHGSGGRRRRAATASRSTARASRATRSSYIHTAVETATPRARVRSSARPPSSSRTARRPGRAAHHVVHRGARDVGAAARPRSPATRSSCRRSRSSPPRSPSLREGARILFCDIERRDARPRSRAPRRAARRLGARRRPGPLRRGRLRHGRHRRRARSWPRRRGRRGQRARPVRPYRGRPLGSFGRFATLSFHETKNFICGEGGALIVNDAADVDRAHVLLRQGHEPPRVHARPGRQVLVAGHRLVVRPQRGARRVPLRAARATRRDPREAPRPCSTATGSCSSRSPSELTAAGCRSCPPTASRRTTCSTCCSPTDATRNRALAIDARGAACTPTFHYVPLHSSPGGQRFAARDATAPSPTTSAVGCCGCRSTPTSPTRTPTASCETFLACARSLSHAARRLRANKAAAQGWFTCCACTA